MTHSSSFITPYRQHKNTYYTHTMNAIYQMLVLVLVLKDYLRTNFKSLSLSLSLWHIEKSLFFQFSSRVRISQSIYAENIFKKFEVFAEVFGAKWLHSEIRNYRIRPVIRKICFWKGNLLTTCLDQYLSILWCRLFFRFNLLCCHQELFMNKNSGWWRKQEL